jgi:hypothetical protein
VTTKITNYTQRIAEDEGEFESAEEAAAWVAGAVLAFGDAKNINVFVKTRFEAGDSIPGGGFFMRPRNVWEARVEASWPQDRETSESPVRINMTPVLSALIDVKREMDEDHGEPASGE